MEQPLRRFALPWLSDIALKSQTACICNRNTAKYGPVLKKIPTQINRKYTVSSALACTITDSSGTILCNVSPHLQTDFTAISNSITFDDDSAVISLLYCPHSGNCTGNGEGQNYTTGTARILRPGHILDLGELTVDTDLSTLNFAESGNVQTAELWLSSGSTVPTITWPTDAVWVGYTPALSSGMAYRLALRHEPKGKLIISPAYEYTV